MSDYQQFLVMTLVGIAGPNLLLMAVWFLVREFKRWLRDE